MFALFAVAATFIRAHWSEVVDTAKVAKDTDAMLQDVHTKVSEIHTIVRDLAKALPTVIAALDASSPSAE